MGVDPTGEFGWATVGRMAIGAVVGAATYAVTQMIAGEPINGASLARSAGEGALTAVSGTVASAAISGISAFYSSYKAGKNLGNILLDTAIATGGSLIGSGGKYLGGRFKLENFKNTSTKKGLKALGNYLSGTHGNKYKQLANWDKELNRRATRYFMNSRYANYLGYLGSTGVSVTYSLVRSGARSSR